MLLSQFAVHFLRGVASDTCAAFQSSSLFLKNVLCAFLYSKKWEMCIFLTTARQTEDKFYLLDDKILDLSVLYKHIFCCIFSREHLANRPSKILFFYNKIKLFILFIFLCTL
jgi:hypothetical protein